MSDLNKMTKDELKSVIIERDKMITNLQFKGLDVPKAADEVGRFDGVVTIHASKAPEYRGNVPAEVELRVHTETGRLDLREMDIATSERGPWLRTPSRTYVSKKGVKPENAKAVEAIQKQIKELNNKLADLGAKETRVYCMNGRRFLDNVIITIGKALRNGFRLTPHMMDPEKADAFDAIMEMAPAFAPKAPAVIGSAPNKEALEALSS